MISMISENSDNDVLYGVNNMKYEFVPPYEIPLYPKLSHSKCWIKFDDWLLKYGDDVDDIIDAYIHHIRDVCAFNELGCIMNTTNIREKMYHLIYKTSMNRYKYYQDLVD